MEIFPTTPEIPAVLLRAGGKYSEISVSRTLYLQLSAPSALRGGPNFGPVKYVKEVSHVKDMHANSLLVHPYLK